MRNSNDASSTEQLKKFRKEINNFHSRLESVSEAKIGDGIVNIFGWGDDSNQLEELSNVYASLNNLYLLIESILDDMSNPADYDGTED